jgi:predicted nucleic acid-binding protein
VIGLVIDASIAVKWYVREDDSEQAHALLTRDSIFSAPSLLRAELASGLWKNWRRGFINRDQARDAQASIEKTVAFWHDTDLLLPAAIELSYLLSHHIYDCLYLALARELRCHLVTVDARLLSVAPDGLAVALKDWKPQ